MKINELYIEQTNQFCEANCKITAQDILAKAKQKPEINDKNDKKTINETKTNRYKTMFRLSHVAVACICFILLAGTGVLAFGGHGGHLLGTAGATVVAFDHSKLELFLLKNWKDYTSAELVQQGYVHEINKVMEDDNYKIELIAFTGDKNVPRLLLDLYIKDEAVAEKNDRIFVNAYILSPAEYENNKSDYACYGAYGVKDEEISNLYHVNMECKPAWITEGETIVIDVCSVYTNLTPETTEDLSYWTFMQEEFSEIGVTPEFTINETYFYYSTTIPEDAFSNLTIRHYHDMVFSSSKYDYELEKVEYGHYRMDMTFSFYYPEGTAADYADSKTSVEDRLFVNWKNLATEMSLIVDGEEYPLEETNMGSVNWDFEGKNGSPNHCYIYPSFPDVDYYEADSIILKVGDVSYDLKESE